MKKTTSLILALVLCLSMCACGNSFTDNSTENNSSGSAASTSPATEPACQHNWENATCTDPKTCKACGETEGTKLGHDWVNANCTDPKTCKTCGDTEGTKLGHDWKDATCTDPKTCKTCGDTEGTKLGHNWKDATCTDPKICKTCGDTEGTKVDHSYNDATCTQPKTCKHCGQTIGEATDCTVGSDGCCIYCGRTMIEISSILSAPMDSLNEISSFVSRYYYGDCYSKGNFRLIFNSADGVILSWGATNVSDKTIKYITFTIEYYNNVGDPARDELTGKTSYTARLTGPIAAGKSFYLRELIGYGSDISYGVITNMEIEFMDGTKVSGTYGYTTWHNIRSSGSPKECFIIED